MNLPIGHFRTRKEFAIKGMMMKCFSRVWAFIKLVRSTRVPSSPVDSSVRSGWKAQGFYPLG